MRPANFNEQRRGGIRTFDAFPKVASSHTIRSERGGYSTLMTMICILFFTWVELGHFFGGEIAHQFVVDSRIGKDLKINLDIVVAMPCNFITTNVNDITDDRFLASELLKYEGFPFFIPSNYVLNEYKKIETPDIDTIMAEGIVAEFRQREDDKKSGAPACHIYGNIPVNKVSGNFHITAKGYGYRNPDRSYVPIESLNFTHVISELSFGDFYPYIQNPLDTTARLTSNHLENYIHSMNVIPTTYKKLGVEIETYQYSVSTQINSYSLEKRGIPGIFFKYDFEALTLVIEDKRIAFTTFIVRLATIYGGLIISAKWLYKLADVLLILTIGKKAASRGEEKTTTLLDDE